MESREIAIAMLRAIGVRELEYVLEGGGDSGDATLERIEHIDGQELDKLPAIPVGFDNIGCPRLLAGMLAELVSDAPDGDWVNNGGGSGTVVVRPFEEDEELRFDCDMTFHEEEYGDDDDEGFDDDELDDNETAQDEETRS